MFSNKCLTSEYTGISFIENILTIKNHIPTTKTIERTYQNILCVMSNKGKLLLNITDNKNILKIFKINSKIKERSIDIILFFIFIGTERFKIKSNKYADPAMHEGTISIVVVEFIMMMFPYNNTLSKNIFNNSITG